VNSQFQKPRSSANRLNPAVNLQNENNAALLIEIMTKEEFFFNSQNGVTVGFALPHEDGDLGRMHVIQLQALSRRDDAGKLATNVITALGHKPAQRLVQRGEQLACLFDDYSQKDKLIVIVITSAHLLTPRTIYNLRVITEYSKVGFRKYSPAIILLGHVDTLERAIARYPGVAMRSLSMPVPKPRLVKWD
jgi:hypothetical protein